MPDRHPDLIRVPVHARMRRALLRLGAVTSLVQLLIAPLHRTARAASLPPASSSSARFT